MSEVKMSRSRNDASWVTSWWFLKLVGVSSQEACLINKIPIPSWNCMFGRGEVAKQQRTSCCALEESSAFSASVCITSISNRVHTERVYALRVESNSFEGKERLSSWQGPRNCVLNPCPRLLEPYNL